MPRCSFRASAAQCLLLLAMGTGMTVRAEEQTAVDDRRLPTFSWMEWGVEYRARAESSYNLSFTDGLDDRYFLNRVRVWIGVEPKPWLRFYVQGQDARVAGLKDQTGLNAVQHPLDFRQAWMDLGRPKAKWGVRLGRQELAFGDERLLAADNALDPLGTTFDAVRVTYRRDGMRVDAFGAFEVPHLHDHPGSPDTHAQVYGLFTTWDKAPHGATIEPYMVWKTTREVSFGSYGLRTLGPLPARLDYNVEMTVQAGQKPDGTVRAWMGHWDLGHKLYKDDNAPRASVDYTVGSGDSNPNDGRHETFDDMYSAKYNKYGMVDPFGVRNMHSLTGAMEWPLSKRWRTAASYRSFWLQTTQDGLYVDGDICLNRNPLSPGTHVGTQFSASLAFDISPRSQLAGGWARFFPGVYLTSSGYHGHLSTPYVMWNYRL